MVALKIALENPFLVPNSQTIEILQLLIQPFIKNHKHLPQQLHF